MNNVYIYDSSQIHVYETEDLGSITDVATTVVDHGVKMFDYIVQDGTPGVIHDTLIVPVGQDYIVNEVTGSIDYEDVWITETTYPVSGNINFSGGEENSAAVVFVAIAEPIVLRERAIVVTKQAWTGSGSLFEIGSGLERMVAPYIGGSGTLRISGAADSSETNSYNLDSIIAYGSDADYGLVVAAVGSSHDYGQVTGIVTEGETDNGTVVDLGGSNPFGLFTFAGRSDTPNISKGYFGSGSLRLRGSVDEALDEPFNQIYIVGRDVATGQFVRRDVIGLRFHGGNPEAFARVGYQGSGSLFGFSSGDEAKVYDYTTESVVFVTDAIDNGSVTINAGDRVENYGQVAGIVTEGEFDNGSVTIKQTTRAAEGFFSVSGVAQSVRNRHHVGSGSISIAKHIDSYGEGQSSDIAFLPHYRSRGGITLANHIIPDAFVRSHVGSGSLFEIGQKDERAVFSYNVGLTSVTVPEILLAPWNGTTGYTGTNVNAVASGTGSGRYGGFNSTYSYWEFSGQSSSNTSGTNPRILTLGPLDLTNYNQYEFTAIAGTSNNGGENCDAAEDLIVSYSTDGGTTYNQIVIFDAEDARFTGSTFGLVTRDIPEAAKTSNVILKFHQEKHSGSAFDQWGIEYVKVLESTTLGSGQVYDTIDSVDQGTVDQSAGVNEDYGTITIPFTNGIQDYGQLNPASFKFGDIKISGGDSAHANPRAYRGAIERVTENPIPTTTILPDDLVNVASYNTVFYDVNVRNAGTGTGSAGGFNIGRHLAFEGGSTVDHSRSLTFEIDTREFDQMAITVIRGDGSNGGDTPEVNEQLRLWYSPDPQYQGGANGFLLWGNILAHDSADGTAAPVRKVFNISGSFFNNENQRFRITQANADGSADNYAITQIEFLNSSGVLEIDPFDLQPTSFSLSGSADIQIQEPPTQIYRYGLTQNQTSKGEFFKIGGGMSDIKVVKGSWVGSGALFNSGALIEKTSFDYNDSSIATVETPIDNGQITSSGSATDYGQVTEYAYGETNYGQVGILQTTQPFGKLYELSGGDIAHSNPVAYLGSTARISITGGYSNLKFVSQAGESTALFEIRNGLGGEGNTYASVKPFIGSGSLFHIGDRLESKIYSYTTASIAPTDQQYDNGSVTSASTTNEDYGSITNLFDPGLAEDYGDVSNIIGDENPFGLYRIYGAAEEQYFPTFNWNRQSPPIRIFNDQQDPADFRFRPHWRTDTTTTNPPRISNGPGGEFHTYAQVRPFIGSGRLFGLGDKFESATFRYTTESIVVVENPEDYGLITSTPTQNLEYGTISSAITPGGEFDNGQVGITQTTESLTGLYKFSGESKDQFLRGPYVVKDGLIKIYKGKSAATDFRFMPHWRSRPYEQGKLTGIAETPRARDFVGAGRLFGLGDKFESATFRYTTESIVVVEQPEDYGLITSNATQNLDFGDVSSAITPDGEVDFGQVVITQTTQSATGLYKFSGESKDQFFRGPYVAKEGFIRFYKGQSADTDFRFMPHWRGVPDEQFKVSGSAETPRGRDFVGTGSLFNIGDKIEKKVYNYTTESIEVVQPSDDWGSITTSGGTLDYGDIGSAITPGGEFDFGQVVITQTTQSATGLFRFSGEGAEVKSSTPPAERFEISISGSAIEKVTSGDDENTILFNFTGSLTESFGKGLYTGSGSLFEIGQKDERVVFHYNTSSIGDSFGSEDRGSITTTPTTNVDNGLIADETVPPTIDYGFNIDVPGSERPLGQLFEITGADSGHKQTFSEFSSGSLFGASGAAEAAVWQTPEETFLLKMRGGAVEKHVENWVGSGLIKYPEDTPLAPNAAVRFRPHWRGAPDHSPKILGTADSAFKGAYVSKGVFSRMYTHDKGDEWLRYRPSPRYVNSIYGKIGGSAFVNGDGGTRKISVFGYYGDDRDPGTSGSLFGIGGAAESRGITPPLEDTVIFTLNGTAASKFNPHWRGRPDGSPRLYGTPELQLLFNIFTNPEGERFNVYGDAVPVRTINYDGSGTLFTAGSSAEVVGFNPDIETRAFKFSGEPIVRIRVILFGGGSMFGFGSGAESTTIAIPESTVLFVPSGAAVPVITLNYDGSGTEVISGTATEKRTASHVGDGSLFGTGGAAEAVAVSEAESTALFIPSGGDQNSFTRIKQGSGSATINGNAVPVVTLNFNGSGSLFSLGGSSEITTVSEESTGLFEFNGTAEPVIRTRGFAGSGSLFAVGNGAEVAGVSEESTGLFTISGDAEAPFARTKVGSGTTFVSGVKEESFSKGNYDGEGSFSAFGGAAEIVGFDPAEETFLYEFTGNATATRTRGFTGSGTATVLNETVIPVITLNYFGDGSLTTFGGAAESRTVDVENTTLFEFRNGATESFSKGNYDTEGSATVSGEASDIKLTFGNEVFAYVSASGNADESKTDDYVGSGSLFSVVSTTIARTIDYDETSVGAQGEVVSTSLFRISGENPGSVTRITQPTTAEFRTQGESISKVILFSPPRTYSTII